MQIKDRLEALRASPSLNGIDFVEIASTDQKTLRVHFLNTVAVQNTIDAVTITGGESIPTVVPNPIDDTTDWTADAEGHPILTLTVPEPGDFSFYTLTLVSSVKVLDPFFDHTPFTFKALCDSDLDCAPTAPDCPPLEGDMPPIDYLAKDFLSFRQALSDFSALRYPEWQERSEADFGVMFMEALSSLADDLSYLQDRIAAEATLDTATQRRSIVRHARLVDYEPQPATTARVWLQVDVPAGVTALPPGLLVSTLGPDGRILYFETGSGLVDPATGRLNQAPLPVSNTWNRVDASGNAGLLPYYWDDSQRCLQIGATEMWLLGHGFQFATDQTAGKGKGQQLLIDTAAENSADPPIRERVHLISADETHDDLFNVDVTHIVWRPEDALQFDHDLTRTVLAGNMVVATQGRRFSETFAIDTPPAANPYLPLALVRTGPNASADSSSNQYLYTLQHAPMAWLTQEGLDTLPLPEIVLVQQPSLVSAQTIEWRWRRSLLNAEAFSNAFTVDPARFIPVARTSDGSLIYDYDGDAGDTLRFGDGIFGTIPEHDTLFTVTYRVGGGLVSNVAADTITKVEPMAASLLLTVTNPFAAEGGADEETDEQVRRLAPQAFRARQFRAVRPEDYELAAKRLSWVQRAGTVFRWTGSWLTVFTTPDPQGTEELSVDRHTDLIDLLNRYRLAGYESYVPAPHYVSLDLIVRVCAKPDAFRSDVEEAVLQALSTKKFADGRLGFFHPDNFTFGTPLEPSALEAAIQRAYGVDGVISLLYRQRGRIPDYIELTDVVLVSPRDILRVDNDPSKPEHGSIKVYVGGGK